MADLFSRPSALAGSVILLAVGMAVTAGSHSVTAVAAGSVLATMGGTGVDVGKRKQYRPGLRDRKLIERRRVVVSLHDPLG